MQKQTRKRHLISGAVATIVWICLGLALPIVVSIYSSDSALHDAVVAAPRHSFTIARPVVLGQSPSIRVERGTIVLVDHTGKPIKGPAHDEAGQLLPSGGAANLLLENALIAVAATAPTSLGMPSQHPIEASPDAANIAEALAPLVYALATGKYETLLLRRTTLLITVGAHAAEPINDVQATIALRRKGTIAAKGTGLLRGQRVSFDLTTNSPSPDQKSGEARVPIKLLIKAPLGEAQFDGRLGTDGGFDFVGQGEVSIRSVRQLARWFGAFWSPGPGLRDVVAKGLVAFSKQTLSFEHARVSIDGNDATGAVAIAFAGVRPQLTGTLAFKSFDAGSYLFSQIREPQEELSWSTIAASALTVPFGMNLDADLRISADRGKFASFELGRAAATIVMKDGRLLADIAELGFAGGQGGGQIGADFTSFQPKVSLRGRLERADLGLLSTALAGYALVQAPATIVADLTGAGATAPELLASLTGKFSIKSQEGGRLGLDLKQLAATVQTNDVVGWGPPAARGRMAFEQMDLKLIVRDGVLLTDTAETTVGDGAWTATGVLNLPLQRLDIRLIQSLNAPIAKLGFPMRKPAVLELRGTWSQPLIRSLAEPSNAAGPNTVPHAPPVAAAAPDRG